MAVCGGMEIISLYGSTVSRRTGQYPWTVLQDSLKIKINMADSWRNKRSKWSGRPFWFSWGPQNIWSVYLIGREGQLATKPRVPCTLTQVAQLSTAFEAPSRYVKVLLFGWFWEQHTRHSEGANVSRFCCVPWRAKSTLNCLCNHIQLGRLCQRYLHQSMEVWHPPVSVAFWNSVPACKSDLWRVLSACSGSEV